MWLLHLASSVPATLSSATPTSSLGVAELALAGSALTVVGVIIAAIITARRMGPPGGIHDPAGLVDVGVRQGRLEERVDEVRGDLDEIKSDVAEVKTDVGEMKSLFNEMLRLLVPSEEKISED